MWWPSFHHIEVQSVRVPHVTCTWWIQTGLNYMWSGCDEDDDDADDEIDLLLRLVCIRIQILVRTTPAIPDIQTGDEPDIIRKRRPRDEQWEMKKKRWTNRNELSRSADYGQIMIRSAPKNERTYLHFLGALSSFGIDDRTCFVSAISRVICSQTSAAALL